MSGGEVVGCRARYLAGLLHASVIMLILLVFAASADSRRPVRTAVDLKLVIAADVSTSMDREEKQLQLGGFVAAFRDPAVIRAIERGRRGRILVTYIEWGGQQRQRVVVPWTLVDGAEAARGFANSLEMTFPGRFPGGTAIGDVLDFSEKLLDESDVEADRRVIDLSGDGVNNRGRPLALVREKLLERGVVINGLPIVYREPSDEDPDVALEEVWPPEMLIDYYKNEIIGGEGAFVEPVRTRSMYAQAIRDKLVREIAGGPAMGDQAALP